MNKKSGVLWGIICLVVSYLSWGCFMCWQVATISSWFASVPSEDRVRTLFMYAFFENAFNSILPTLVLASILWLLVFLVLRFFRKDKTATPS